MRRISEVGLVELRIFDPDALCRRSAREPSRCGIDSNRFALIASSCIDSLQQQQEEAWHQKPACGPSPTAFR